MWFAIDALGYLAEFDSRESGLVPLAVFENSKDEHLRLFEYFVRPSEEQMTGDVSVDAPKQGLFFYDIAEYMTLDGYERLGVPQVAIVLSQCPEEIRSLIERVRFDGTFRETPMLRVKKHWKCV